MDTSDIPNWIGIGVAVAGIGVMFFPPTHLTNNIRLWIAYPLIIIGIGIIVFPFLIHHKKIEYTKSSPVTIQKTVTVFEKGNDAPLETCDN